MKSIIAATTLSVLLLAACHDDEPEAAAASVTVGNAPMAAGNYLVSIGDENSPTSGRLYQTANGSRMLIVNDAGDLASAIYTSSTNGVWQRVPPAPQGEHIELQQSSAMPGSSSQLAGDYSTLVQGVATGFSLASDGKISASANVGCKLSGQLDAAEFSPGVRKLSLTFSQCATLSGTLSGVLIQDADYAPARLRMVLDNGTQITELWAYAE